MKLQKQMCEKHKVSFFKNVELLKTYQNLVKKKVIAENSFLKNLLIMKQTRSMSGIVVVSVLTKPYPCPGKCLYCPSEKNVPKSYLSNEPAVMRAIKCKFDPYLQTASRLRALEIIGHPTDKINIRIIGGTWSYYPKNYQTWFIKRLFEACNQYNKITIKQVNDLASIQSTSLEEKNGSQAHWKNAIADTPIKRTFFFDKRANLFELQKQNETAKHRVVEISIETRQDFINKREIMRLRNLGVTKVELGVQSLDDKILALNNRGHDVKETIHATKILKDAGFKVSYQMMVNLYGSNIKKDKSIFKELFANQDFKPDHLKIYPLALVKGTGLYKLYQNKKFTPYNKLKLINLLKYVKRQVPYYTRIERVIRDIPSENIVEGGAKFSNMRQVLDVEMKKENDACKCIRCREVRQNQVIKLESYQDDKVKKSESGSQKWIANATERSTTASVKRTSFGDGRANIYFFREKYKASDGIEYFLSFENKSRTKLYSLLRLRIPSKTINRKPHFIPALNNSSIIREIHTYGKQLEISKKDKNASQHQGFGKKLILEAEIITKSLGLNKISAISGVGVRGYFKKLGFSLQDSYMIKNLQ
jgi:elongator complex protein 3